MLDPRDLFFYAAFIRAVTAAFKEWSLWRRKLKNP